MTFLPDRLYYVYYIGRFLKFAFEDTNEKLSLLNFVLDLSGRNFQAKKQRRCEDGMKQNEAILKSQDFVTFVVLLVVR